MGECPRVGEGPRESGGLSVYYVFPITTDTSLKKECNCRHVLPTTSFITHFQFFNSSILQSKILLIPFKKKNATTSLKKECNYRPVLPTTSFITHFPFFNSSIL